MNKHNAPDRIALDVNLSTAEDPSRAPCTLNLAYLLACVAFVGPAGLHRFYMRKFGTGILYLLTWGFLGIGTILDLIRMRTLVRDANIRSGHMRPRFRLSGQGDVALDSPARLDKPADLRMVLLRAAQANDGVLTVTQGVMESGRSFADVERALNEMVDKGYVDIDNAPSSGVVIYRFHDFVKG